MDKTIEQIKRAHQGDKTAREALVKDNLGLVWSIVRRFAGRGCETEDLFQIGSIGLLKAIDKFDLSYEVRFSTYAVPMIAGEIKRFLRDDGIIKVSRSIKEQNQRLRAARDALCTALGREPTLEELAAQPDLFSGEMNTDRQVYIFRDFYSVSNELGYEADLFVLDADRNPVMSSRSALPEYLKVDPGVDWGIFASMETRPGGTAVRLMDGWKKQDRDIALGRTILNGEETVGYLVFAINSSRFQPALDQADTLLVMNKSDLPGYGCPMFRAEDTAHTLSVVGLSAKTGLGLEFLEEELVRRAQALLPQAGQRASELLLTNQRQTDAVRRAAESVARAGQALEQGVTPDALLTDVEQAMAALGELTGRTVREDITSRIFQRFCVGK